ncbi:MAG: undecaprenyl/decaprenyl-phosphate alpha-N-acetylglucosaminyl 1-phosphate transferase [bacterium]|nr:undecaprenyl/decaprenyl-phosphate alpha-N-acetylglucosaminyl 1-phosphate transferase [bacterium]
MTYLIALCFSILLSSVLVPLFMKFGLRMGILDQPGARKVHTQPIPRTGGLAVIIGSITPLIFLITDSQLLLGICLGALCILLVGLSDDIWELNYGWKFLGQFMAAAVTLLVCNLKIHSLIEIYPGLTLNLNLISFPLSLLFVVFTINVFNLADGLDGLAGGSCLLAFCCTAFFAYFREEFRTVALCVCMIGSIIGFLRYNTYPATVFLGDTGSLFLGFMVGVSMILLTGGNCIYSPVISVYIIGIPIMDTLMVMLERFMDHRPVFKADKNHIHHKLMKMGLKHHEAVASIYFMQFLMTLLAWSLRFCSDGTLIAIYFLILTSFLAFFFLQKKGYLKVLAFHQGETNQAKKSLSHVWGISLFSSASISHLAWWGLVMGMVLFGLLSPLAMRPFSRQIGLICCSLIVTIIIFRRLKPKMMEIIAKFAAYFISLSFIFSLEFQITYLKPIFNILFIGMGACYLVYLVTAQESVPISTMDYLLLMGVVSTFFIPRAYPELIHLKNITVRTLFVVFYIELLFSKLKGEKFIFMLWPILITLGLTCAAAF